MKFRFLGTSHGIAEKDRFTSSILIETGSKSYVIDAGAPIMKLLLEADVDFRSIGGIFITHSHCDHFLGLVEFINQIECFREFSGVKIKVRGPENFPFDNMRRFLFGDESEYGTSEFIPPKTGGSRKGKDGEGHRILFERYCEGVIHNDGIMKITAIKTEHCPDSHAFLIECEGKRVLITGDLRTDLSDMPSIAFSQHLDLVITEAAHPLWSEARITDIARNIRSPKIAITHVCPFRNTEESISVMKSALKDTHSVTVVSDGDIIEI